MVFWADIDNAPHVLVLRPIIEWLTRAGHVVEITARDYGQTLPLLDLFGMPYTVVGRHAGKRTYRKVLSFITRSIGLLLFARKRRFAAAFCHGTRGVFIPAKLLGIPLVVMSDYEHAATPNFMRRWPSMLLVPEVIPREAFGCTRGKAAELRKYPGLKEELYVYDCEPDPGELLDMQIDLARPVILVRPPASMAHYHVRAGDDLFLAVLEHLRRRGELQVILLPRTRDQAAELKCYLQQHPAPNVRVPDKVTYGPNLIYHSDLVISGGGTMNREAACMDVPVVTIFQGALGAVDKYLMDQGRLKMMEDVRMLDSWSFQRGPRADLKVRRRAREKLATFIGESILSVARAPADR